MILRTMESKRKRLNTIAYLGLPEEVTNMQEDYALFDSPWEQIDGAPVTSEFGSPIDVTVSQAFTRFGRTVFFRCTATINDPGDASGFLLFLPIIDSDETVVQAPVPVISYNNVALFNSFELCVGFADVSGNVIVKSQRDIGSVIFNTGNVIFASGLFEVT